MIFHLSLYRYSKKMNHVIIVAGGIGSRMNSEIPKQYLLVKGVPVFMYSVCKFIKREDICSIVLVIADKWKPFVEEHIHNVEKKQEIIFASAGQSRQHSVLNGLHALEGVAADEDLVFVHDSVRPLFPLSNIDDGIEGCRDFDATLPVITVKDATYQSQNGRTLSSILPRNELFSGQSPECFRFRKYLDAHRLFTEEQISSIRGSAELAYRAGLQVKLISGTEANFKITTTEDLRAFELLIS